MVRGGDLDVSEMALTTHLLAHHFRKPLTALPLPLWRRLHHANLVCAAVGSAIVGRSRRQESRGAGLFADHRRLDPWHPRVAIRRRSQPDHVGHHGGRACRGVSGPGAVRHTGGKSLRDLLLSGELAAIMGERDVDPNHIRPVIADADAAAEKWSGRPGSSRSITSCPFARSCCRASLAGRGADADVRGCAGEIRCGLCPTASSDRTHADAAGLCGKPKADPAHLRVDELFPKASHTTGVMIIDIHGHYTTEPPALHQFRDKQLAGLADPLRRPTSTDLGITDEMLLQSVQPQLKLQKERGSDLTIFSPRAAGMAHHVGTEAISMQWTTLSNDLIHRICNCCRTISPPSANCRSIPASPPKNCISELERIVTSSASSG